MAILYNKSDLISVIDEVMKPRLDSMVYSIASGIQNEIQDEVIDICSRLKSDIVKMFGYTKNGECWEHLENIELVNPFWTFRSVDTVAEKEVTELLYEIAEFYFSQGVVRSEILTLFYLDFITSVCFRSMSKIYSDDIFIRFFPNLYSAIDRFDGEHYRFIFIYIAKKIIKNFIYFGFAFLLALFSMEGNVLPGLLAAFLIGYKFFSWHRILNRYKIDDRNAKRKLEEICRFYRLFGIRPVAWNLIFEDLIRLRAVDVVLPLVICSAIEQGRLNANFAH